MLSRNGRARYRPYSPPTQSAAVSIMPGVPSGFFQKLLGEKLEKPGVVVVRLISFAIPFKI